MSLQTDADIDTHRAALLRLATWLFAVAGLVPGEKAVLRRVVRGAVLSSLRPLESALRRLIVVVAEQLKQTGFVAKAAIDRATRSMSTKPNRRREGLDVPLYALFDQRLRVGESGNRKYAKVAPQIRSFDDPYPIFDVVPEKRPISPNDLLDATNVFNRLQALRAALDDLSKQAKRLLRVRARLAKAGKGHVRPMRPGRPPGHRARGRYEADEVLRSCHQMALRAMAAPDTS